MKNTIRLVTIGAGPHAACTHGPALRALAEMMPELELSAVCDIDRIKAEKYAADFGYRRVYTDYRAMLDAEAPSGVTLVTPVHLTAAIGSEILSRRIPLLLEKPPGRNPAELEQLAAAYEAGQTPHLVAFNRRYMPLVTQASELWADRMEQEKVIHLRGDFYRHNRYDQDFSTTAIHGIDLAEYLLGSRFREVDISVQRLSGSGGGAYNIFLDCRFAGGESALLSFCPVSGCCFERFHLNSEHYGMTVEVPSLGSCDVPGRIDTYRYGKRWSSEFPAPHRYAGEEFFIGGFFAENLSFIDMLRENRFRPDDADLKKVVGTVKVAAAVGEAIRTGRNARLVLDV